MPVEFAKTLLNRLFYNQNIIMFEYIDHKGLSHTTFTDRVFLQVALGHTPSEKIQVYEQWLKHSQSSPCECLNHCPEAALAFLRAMYPMMIWPSHP
jgi:hypothetical protein